MGSVLQLRWPTPPSFGEGVSLLFVQAVVGVAPLSALLLAAIASDVSYVRDTFSLTCARPEAVEGSFVVETDGVAVAGFGTGGNDTVVSVSTWAVDHAHNDTAGTGSKLLADLQAISVTVANGVGAAETEPNTM